MFGWVEVVIPVWLGGDGEVAVKRWASFNDEGCVVYDYDSRSGGFNMRDNVIPLEVGDKFVVV